MLSNRIVAVAVGGLALVIGLGACSAAGSQADETATAAPQISAASASDADSDSGKAGSNTSTSSGAYIKYSDYFNDPGKYRGTETVLFFSAKWCPSCVAADESITQSGVPSGMTIVEVDFDSSQELKQKYGVTVQHTFVQVDDKEQELGKFTGSITVEEIQEQLV